MITFTIQIATPICGIWARKAAIPPAHSRMAIMCVKLAKNLRIEGLAFDFVDGIGPILFEPPSGFLLSQAFRTGVQCSINVRNQ